MNPTILLALRAGNIDRVLALLQDDPTQIDRVTIKGNNIFHIAASNGTIQAFSSPFIELLERQNRRGLLLHQNERGDTILHCAARTGQTDILNFVIPFFCGAETESLLIGVQNKCGDTALHEAVRGGHVYAVRRLVAAGPKMAAVVNGIGESPLYLAADRGSVDAVEMLLGCSTVAVGGPRGQTALHAAVCRSIELNPVPGAGEFVAKSLDIAKKLLEIKPELNQQVDASQSAPIHYAASLGDVKMVRLLLQYDASVAYLLDNNGLSAIHIAAREDNANMIEVILHHCPDATELTDTRGRNFLHVAINNKRTAAMAVLKLVLNNSLLGQSINETDDEGNTPLHLAVQNCSMRKVHLLLSIRKINANIRNRNALTPLDMALSSTDSSNLFRMSRISEELISTGSMYGPRRMDITMRKERDEKEEELNKFRANSLALVAVLVATVTFAAAFTLPGGYAGGDGKHEEGMAILAKKVAFKIFLISDAIAMLSSVCATFVLIYSGSFDLDLRSSSLTAAVKLLLVSLIGMVVAFCTGINVVMVSKCKWLAFLICGLAICIPYCSSVMLFWPFTYFIKRDPRSGGKLVDIRLPRKLSEFS